MFCQAAFHLAIEATGKEGISDGNRERMSSPLGGASSNLSPFANLEALGVVYVLGHRLAASAHVSLAREISAYA